MEREGEVEKRASELLNGRGSKDGGKESDGREGKGIRRVRWVVIRNPSPLLFPPLLIRFHFHSQRQILSAFTTPPPTPYFPPSLRDLVRPVRQSQPSPSHSLVRGDSALVLVDGLGIVDVDRIDAFETRFGIEEPG